MAPELCKFAAGTAPSGWNRHLWKIPALGLSQQSGSPRPNRGGRPPTTKRWGHAKNKEPASPASQSAILWSSQPPLDRRRVFPFHRTDPAVKAHGCSSACLRLQGETDKRPQEGKGGLGTGWGQNGDSRLLHICSESSLQNRLGRRRSHQLHMLRKEMLLGGLSVPASLIHQVCKVSEGAWEFLKEAIPLRSSPPGGVRG